MTYFSKPSLFRELCAAYFYVDLLILSLLGILFSSFLTADRLEKLNSVGFVWSVRGESSSTEKDTTDPLSVKAEPVAVLAVDTAMTNAGMDGAVQTGESGGEVATLKVEQPKTDEETEGVESSSATTTNEVLV